MATEIKREIQLEIAHVLFMDIVGYSKLLINDQRALLDALNKIVRSTEEFRSAENATKLIKIPTGDGMALVFNDSLEAPVDCALEISRALKTQPNLPLRMGVHSGPVSGVIDVNERANVAGAGINMAQRVMDCGDAGHILLSRHVAEDLEQYGHWKSHLHDLGECEVKHGVRVHIVNLYTEELGNPEPPEKFKHLRGKRKTSGTRIEKVATSKWPPAVAAILISALLVAGSFTFWHRTSGKLMSDPLSVIPEKSIAVLPFENLSRDPDNAFFADGVQDAILTELAKIADLKVISRTSVMQYKSVVGRNLREIGKELGVAHLLEGSVQRISGKLRINAQLIDARADAHLWAENYDRPVNDIFAIESEIAKTIAQHLQAKLSPTEEAAIDKPATTDLTAYNLYQRARLLFADSLDQIHAKEKLPQAARLLDEAIGHDPRFLLAWCLLSKVHGAIYWFGFDTTSNRLDLANAAVQTALRLQPDSGEAHLALALYYYHGFRDYKRARAELAIARRTLPNNAEVFASTGYIDRREGRWEDATRNQERAVELDPRDFFTLQELASIYGVQRRYADQLGIYDRALTVIPGDPATRIYRAQIAVDWRADIKPLQATLAMLVAEDPGVAPDVDYPDYALCERTAAAAARFLTNYPRDGVENYGVNFPHTYWEGVVARWQGDSAKTQIAFAAARREVEKTLEKQPDFPAALSLLGMIDAGLGRKDIALREGHRACDLLPISMDSIDGTILAVNLAQIYAWTNEKDLAVEQIAAVERVPSSLHYGFLKLHPIWDSLRNDPRFEKIVASLAPKN